MLQAELLSTVMDFYGLKKEGKIVSKDDTPSLVVNKLEIKGLLPILSQLNTLSGNIMGSSNLEKSLVRQWIQFQFGCLDLSDRKITEAQFRKLNENLCNKTFLAGENFTVADVLLYHGIHKVYTEMSFQEKDKFIHLSRWFKNIQQDQKLRRGKSVIAFSRMKLY